MADEIRRRKPEAVYEPGTLENTRRNIGALDPEEAAKMTKILGGEIFTEKSVPIDYSKLPKKPIQRKPRTASGSGASRAPATIQGTISKTEGHSRSKAAGSASRASIISVPNLPSISAKDNMLMDKLMMSPDYGIKPNYGMFNFIKRIQKDGAEKLVPEFVEINLKCHIEHINAFVTVIKSIIQYAPDSYKSKVQAESDTKFKFLRTVAQWNLNDVRNAYSILEKQNGNAVIAELLHYTKAIYRPLLTIYYLSEPIINRTIKDIYADISGYPNTDLKKYSSLAKEAITEWMYIHNQIIKGMYPILMRLCGTPYEEFPRFFTAQTSAILNFTGLKKFDLLLKEKKPDPEIEKKAKEQEEKAKKEAEQKKEEQREAELKNDMVDAGLKLLNKMFPDAGFDRLEEFPDMCPYFDPLYDFDENFVYISPDNPVQITLTLHRIIEDFLVAAHNIKFDVEGNPSLSDKRDSIQTLINEWPVYREEFYEKKYSELLKTLVNQTYTNPAFNTSQLGKRTITEIYWLTKYSFLPHFDFEQLILERPLNDSKYIAMCTRVSFLRSVLVDLTKQISASEAAQGSVGGLSNPWEHYKFDLPSPVSKRLDVLLNGKNNGPKPTANNANLIKYLACIVSVMDWWVNAKKSPAYNADPKQIYRKMKDSDEPAFSCQLRTDQDKLFANAIKAAIQKKTAAK